MGGGPPNNGDPTLSAGKGGGTGGMNFQRHWGVRDPTCKKNKKKGTPNENPGVPYEKDNLPICKGGETKAPIGRGQPTRKNKKKENHKSAPRSLGELGARKKNVNSYRARGKGERVWMAGGGGPLWEKGASLTDQRGAPPWGEHPGHKNFYQQDIHILGRKSFFFPCENPWARKNNRGGPPEPGPKNLGFYVQGKRKLHGNVPVPRGEGKEPGTSPDREKRGTKKTEDLKEKAFLGRLKAGKGLQR